MKLEQKNINKVLLAGIIASALTFWLWNDYGFGWGVLILVPLFAGTFFGLERLRPRNPLGRHSEHLTYLLVIVLLATLYCHSYFSLTQLVNLDYEVGDFPDMVKYSHPFVKVMRDAYLGGRLPLWSPWTWGGYPFQATPDKPALYPFLVVFLLMPTTYGALNASVIFHIMLAGLGMYWLVWSLEKTKEGALMAGILYMLSGVVVSMLDVGGLPYIITPAWAPLAFLFAHKALFSKDWVKYSLLSAVSFALMFHAGGIQYVQYTGIMVALYYLYYLLLKLSPQTIKKMVLIGLVVGPVLGGLIAVKLIPNLDYVEITNRAGAYERSEWPGVFSNLRSIRYYLITPLFDRFGDVGAHIGVIGFVLMLYSLKTIKRPRTLFMVLAMLLGISLASASPVYQFFWKYVPGINQGIYVQRFLMVYTLAAAFLAGIGTRLALQGSKPAKRTLLLALVVLLAFAELTFITYKHSPSEDLDASMLENKALQYVKAQPGRFRFHSLQSGGIDSTMAPYTVPMELYTLYGFDGSMWITEYMNEFLGVGMRVPDKTWGIMNVKYLMSTEPVEHPSFKFIDKFPECERCFPDRVDGPYLYENTKYLPRAFTVDHAALVIGGEGKALEWYYTLYLHPSFDPAKGALVLGEEKRVPDYSYEYLKRFDAIFLADTLVDAATVEVLGRYVAEGGRVFPDVTQGKDIIGTEEVEGLFASFAEPYTEANIRSYEPESISIDSGGGFLVLSEKFYMFPEGWRAELNGEPLAIERADGGVSAVYLPNTGTVTFTYFPADFKRGMIITGLTLSVLGIYLMKRGVQASR